jgi:hypothetical protein
VLSTTPTANQWSETPGECEDLRFAYGVANPRANRSGKISRQLVKASMCLNEQVQSAQLLEHPAWPADTREFTRDGPQHAGDTWGLSIDHPRGHRVKVAITSPFQTRNAAAYLITEPLVELVEAQGNALSACRSPLGRLQQDRPTRPAAAEHCRLRLGLREALALSQADA